MGEEITDGPFNRTIMGAISDGRIKLCRGFVNEADRFCFTSRQRLASGGSIPTLDGDDQTYRHRIIDANDADFSALLGTDNGRGIASMLKAYPKFYGWKDVKSVVVYPGNKTIGKTYASQSWHLVRYPILDGSCLALLG